MVVTVPRRQTRKLLNFERDKSVSVAGRVPASAARLSIWKEGDLSGLGYITAPALPSCALTLLLWPYSRVAFTDVSPYQNR
jgi:hypothetical protein